MIERFVTLIRPIIVPLLKLETAVPHLPEGSTLVQHLRPTEQWLTYHYLGALFGMFFHIVGTAGAVVALVAKATAWSRGLAGLVVLTELAVICLTFVTIRVDYELRHYLVGSRSLRVSMGAITRREVTLSYANVQNIEVTQGPIERIFGYKSLTISTAGGSTLSAEGQNLHAVTLAGLEDAEAVRALILGMLTNHRDSGLGEPVQSTNRHELSLDHLLEIRDAAVELQKAVVAREQLQKRHAL
jgi:membrane protein YdbS with pleckstrin-like domain